MIDSGTLENLIVNSSRQKFSVVCRLLLREVFHIEATDVDGKGDGGGDFVTIPATGGARSFVSQITVQAHNWQAKAIADADKAVKELRCTRYFFFTSRRHSSAALREVESRIATRHQIPATCLGGREIADMLVSRELTVAALDALGVPALSSLSGRMDRNEILLHSCAAIGTETANLRDQVYEDALLLVLRDHGPRDVGSLIQASIDWLACGPARQGRLRSRLDALLTRGYVRKDTASGRIHLTLTAENGLRSAERIYLAELESLASSQAALLEGKHDVDWPMEAARKCSVLLARAFIKRHLETVARASAKLNKLQLVDEIGDPIQEIRDLIAAAGVSVAAVNSVVEEFVANASDTPLIDKLVRGALYTALEGGNPLQMSRALGVASWREVTVFVDASVLIPYLCARLFEPTAGRFSHGAIRSLQALQDVGAQLVTSQDYINEAATHLLKAREYCSLADADEWLPYSTNGYVSHYYRLLGAKRPLPPDLLQFLGKFSSALFTPLADTARWIRALMGDIQRMLSDYGIRYEHVKRVDVHFSDRVDREYGFVMRDRGLDRPNILIQHDEKMLAHMRKLSIQGTTGLLCLTWDRLMIEVSGRVNDCGWVVTPHEAADFVQTSDVPRGAQLLSLAHKLAAVHERPSEIVAELLDRLVSQVGSDLMDWQMQDQLAELRDKLYARMDTDTPEFEEWARHEASAVFREVVGDVGRSL